MAVESASAPYGPDYFRALLAQKEDEVQKPKRTPIVLRDIMYIRRKWDLFRRDILGPNVESLERLRTLSLRDLQVFFEWYLRRQQKLRKLRSVLNVIKTFNMMFRDDIGRSLDQEIVSQINTYARVNLLKTFDLDPTVSLKESSNQDDLHHLLEQLWIFDTHIYPVERQRLQTAFLVLLIALTTVRPGALVESSCYSGSNQALLYNNIVMRLVRDPEDISRTVLLMEVTTVLWKGDRETMKPVTFVFYEHDCLIFCPILHMLGLAFADDAFDSPGIRCAQDIHDLTIPPFKESLSLKWKDEWLPRPIFRRACSSTNGVSTSLIKALPYSSFRTQISALGKKTGFRRDLTAYAFRRGAAQVVNKIATPAERNQIMGHSNSSIVERFYQNRVVSTDVSAAFLKMPSRSSLLASVGHIGIDRDPRVPLKLDKEEQDAVLRSPEIIRLNECIRSSRANTQKEYCVVTDRVAWTNGQKKCLQELRKSRNSLRRRLLKEALDEKRRRFFRYIDNDDIRQIQQGVPVTYNVPLPVYALTARANLAYIFTQALPKENPQKDRGLRNEALQNLVDLCHIREPHHMNPASSAHQGTNPVDTDTASGLKEGETDKGVRRIQEALNIMDLVPLLLPSTICLFCLGDIELANEARTASFSRIDSLRRHVDEIHLSKHNNGELLLCPHPSCDTQCSNVGQFKNHAAAVHNVWLSK